MDLSIKKWKINNMTMIITVIVDIDYQELHVCDAGVYSELRDDGWVPRLI